jgi:hypothetical protein
MDDNQFLNRISAIQEKQQNIFSDEIRSTEKYRQLSNSPTDQLNEKERKLLSCIEELEKRLHYGNTSLLLCLNPFDRKVLISDAEKYLNDITLIVKQINWHSM